MKKWVIAAICFVVGIVGMTISFPMVTKNGIALYNDVVIGYSESPYQEQRISGEVTQLKILNKYSSGDIYVDVRQSPDSDTHFYAYDTPMTSYQIGTDVQGTQAQISINEYERKKLVISKDSIMAYINAEINYDGAFILEVPKTVQITNTQDDRVHFGVQPGTEFVNAVAIQQLDRVTDNTDKGWKAKYMRAISDNEALVEELDNLLEENESLRENLNQYLSKYEDEERVALVESAEGEELKIQYFSTDIVEMENQLEEQKESFSAGQMSRDEYRSNVQDLEAMIQRARESQMIQADREDLLPLLEEVCAEINAFRDLETEILYTRQEYDKGSITQEQYNSIVGSYEESLRQSNLTISELKSELAAEGYYWEGAVVLPQN